MDIKHIQHIHPHFFFPYAQPTHTLVSTPRKDLFSLLPFIFFFKVYIDCPRGREKENIRE
jgi:hypothetical protein